MESRVLFLGQWVLRVLRCVRVPESNAAQPRQQNNNINLQSINGSGNKKESKAREMM